MSRFLDRGTRFSLFSVRLRLDRLTGMMGALPRLFDLLAGLRFEMFANAGRLLMGMGDDERRLSSELVRELGAGLGCWTPLEVSIGISFDTPLKLPKLV